MQVFQNSNKQGDCGLGNAISYFTSLGYTVATPLTDSQVYDLVVDYNSGPVLGLKRVQVKTSKSTTEAGVFKVKLSTTQRWGKEPFDRNKVDYVFVLDNEDGRWLIPAQSIDATSKIHLSGKYKEYKLASVPFSTPIPFNY